MSLVGGIDIKACHIMQVAIVVKDIQKTIENYWRLFGFGPWTVFDFKPPLVHSQRYHGEPSVHTFKVTCTNVGSFELELLEPLEGVNIYSDFIAEYGEGLHHVRYDVDTLKELDEHIENFRKMGYKSLMDGRIAADGGYAYIDTFNALGCILEVVKKTSEMPEPSYRWPQISEESKARIKVGTISQLGLIVRDLEKVVKNYEEILNIKPWDIFKGVSSLGCDATYKGKTSQFTFKAAYNAAAGIQLELIEPISGDSLYGDFLNEYNGGLLSVQLSEGNLAETTRLMNEGGFPILMSFGLKDKNIVYYDTTSELKAIWKAYQIG